MKNPRLRASFQRVALALGIQLILGFSIGCPPPKDTVSDIVPDATITSFTATPSSIAWGHSSTLSWTVAGATSMSIDFGVGVVTGTSVTVSPDYTTTYTLRVLNSHGNSTQATTTVTVLQPTTLTADFFPLANGNTYTYDDGTVVTLTGANGSWVQDWRKDGNTFYRIFFQSDTDGLKQTKEEQWCVQDNYIHLLWEGAPGAVEEWHYWATPFRLLPWGKNIGGFENQSRDEEISVPAGTGGVTGGCNTVPYTDWKYIHQTDYKTINQEERITVPAGKFDTLRIEDETAETNNPNNACGSTNDKRSTFWFAPGVGLVQYQPDSRDPKTIHLVSYTVK